MKEPLEVNVAASADLGRKSVRGGAAVVFGQVFGMVVQLGTMFVLARILSPTDYGLQSMVVTLTAFVSLFRDAGLSAASVQRETLTHEQASTLFWINVALGVLLAVGVALAAPALARFYREPRLMWITVASGSFFLFSSLSVQHRSLLDRTMRFGTGVKIDILSMTIATVVAIVMAVKGFGYWSLICQTISLPVVGTFATWVAMPWWPGRPRWTPELRSMVRFGGTVTLNSVVVYIGYNAEKVLLGRFAGAAPLGIYTRAYQLATLPVQQLTNAVYGVAVSALSRMQSEASRLRRTYLKAHSVIVSLTIPVVICTALFANEIVLIVLGPKWIQVATVLRLLSPTVMVLALINPLGWVLRATGRVTRSLWIAVLIAPVVILGVAAGLRHGPNGVALGYSTAMVLLAVPLVAWAKHGTGITTRDFWDAIKRPLISGVIGGAAGWLAQMLFQNILGTIPLLAVEVTVSFGVYAGTLLFIMGQREFYLTLLSHLLRRNDQLPVIN